MPPDIKLRLYFIFKKKSRREIQRVDFFLFSPPQCSLCNNKSCLRWEERLHSDKMQLCFHTNQAFSTPPLRRTQSCVVTHAAPVDLGSASNFLRNQCRLRTPAEALFIFFLRRIANWQQAASPSVQRLFFFLASCEPAPAAALGCWLQEKKRKKKENGAWAHPEVTLRKKTVKTLEMNPPSNQRRSDPMRPRASDRDCRKK